MTFATSPGRNQVVNIDAASDNIVDGLHGFHIHGAPVDGGRQC